MKSLFLICAGTVLGTAVGIGATLFLLYGWPPETIVFKSNEAITAQGIQIPAGTELVLDRYMPEGFATLRLYLNAEADAWSKFSTRSEPLHNLVVPYWIDTEQ